MISRGIKIMMVIFVSQCEKNAIAKTRRVLDAFADRIGDNTWRTVITLEGLDAVRKLLRQKASKSTAVSCHLIRSRSRSDLLWVVGNRKKFRNNGVVPVNYTSKEVIMDKLPIDIKQFLANTKEQPLSHHLFAVGFLAHALIEKMGVQHEKLAQSCFIAGILHDIGKLDPQFQAWLAKKIKKVGKDYLPEDGVHVDNPAPFSFEKHPRHNEISWLWAQSLLRDNKSLNETQKEQLLHGIYWHHTRPYRKDDSYFSKAKGIDKLLTKSFSETTAEKVYEQVIAVLEDVKLLANHFDDSAQLQLLFPKWNNLYNLTNHDLPAYKLFDDYLEKEDEYQQWNQKNALNDLVRTAVISADRIVSTMSAEDLAEYLVEGTLKDALNDISLDDNGLMKHIEICLQGFSNKFPESERNQKQSDTADKLAELREIAEDDESANIGVLQGPAGCGKTKIALEWAFNTDVKQIFWICPRVQICLGLLHDLTQADYLPNAKIEIITGEYKKILTNGVSLEEAPETADSDYFSGDIVITTIDQVINNIISHSKVTAMVNFMQAHVIFDEFHELIPMQGFNLLLAELIEAKKQRKHHANTLLVSATPHDYFVTELLDIPASYIIRMPSFNLSKYRIELQSYDDKETMSPLIEKSYTDGVKTFVISNTAQDAQIAFLTHQEENSILLHSKYTKIDKSKWFDHVFDCFKQGGNGQFDVLRSGPVVQASLNISCDRMITELTNAENWLQRLGRLDRFGMNNEVNVYTTVIPQSSENGKQTNSTAKFLNQLFSWHSTVAWLDFLKDKLSGKEEVTLNELYTIYQDFYADSSSQAKITKDLQAALSKSVQLIRSKVTDPTSFPPKSKQKDKVMKVARNSLRGDNHFVQMAVCEIGASLQPNYINEYAYNETSDLTREVGLTESVDRITGYGDSDKNLLVFMKAKHHNIKKEIATKAYKDSILLAEARSPENPIYLSYTPKDLEPIGGERERHKYAFYYVKTDRQPVGAMQITKLTNSFED